jgi:hypothetical protein
VVQLDENVVLRSELTISLLMNLINCPKTLIDSVRESKAGPKEKRKQGKSKACRNADVLAAELLRNYIRCLISC